MGDQPLGHARMSELVTGITGFLTLQRKGMLRQHHGLSKIPTKVQEVSEKTELRGLLETEIWPNPGQCSSGAKPHLPSHPHSSPGDAWMSPGWKRVRPGCLTSMCGHSVQELENGNRSRLTCMGLSVCLQGVLLRELGTALIADEGFGAR